MTMIYSTPTQSNRLPTIKRYCRCLLLVPVCVLLISCDSASSNDDRSMATQIAPTDDSVVASDLQSIKNSSQDSSQQADTDNTLDDTAEGQSLIAAAQSKNDAETESSQMISASQSSMLQATLMGDYGGMVSCTSCDSIDVTLNLFADGSVLKTSMYNNPKTPRSPLFEPGIYRQDNDKITIVYESKNIEAYRIQDNHLILMDDNETPDNDYTLSRK